MPPLSLSLSPSLSLSLCNMYRTVDHYLYTSLNLSILSIIYQVYTCTFINDIVLSAWCTLYCLRNKIYYHVVYKFVKKKYIYRKDSIQDMRGVSFRVLNYTRSAHVISYLCDSCFTIHHTVHWFLPTRRQETRNTWKAKFTYLHIIKST